jgi:hypothetical protein
MASKCIHVHIIFFGYAMLTNRDFISKGLAASGIP